MMMMKKKPTWPVQLGGSTYCCGMRIMGGFPIYGEEMQDCDLTKGIEDWFALNGASRSVISTINRAQKKIGVGEVLESFGFKCINAFYNPAHGSFVWLYMFEPKPNRKPVGWKEKR